jgi:hypothetical protein
LAFVEAAAGAGEVRELRSYYAKRLAMFSVGLAVLLLILERIDPANISGWRLILFRTLTSRPAIVIYMVLGELLIRKKLWKLEKPSLNFQGFWSGHTTYGVVQVGHSKVPFVSTHFLQINQDCLMLGIGPPTSDEHVNWGSLAQELAEGNTLRYAYWANYGKLDPQKFPEHAKGYVEMRVTQYDGKKKPKILTGQFWHCAEGQCPVYSGTVVYSRVG